MLDALKRWIAGDADATDWTALAAWARQRGAQFKRTREKGGCVVEGMLDGRAWRLEWGPPQRSYIQGHELRLRMELGLPQDLQMLLLSRTLMETLEGKTFENYTANMQTQIDVSMPEEMRWLAMFQKVPLAAGKEFKSRFAAVASAPRIAAAWLDGPVSERLADAARGPLAAETPLVLMTLRGRVYLRLQLAALDVVAVEAMTQVFETAAAQAVQVAGASGEGSDAWPNTANTAWQTQLQPEDPPR